MKNESLFALTRLERFRNLIGPMIVIFTVVGVAFTAASFTPLVRVVGRTLYLSDPFTHFVDRLAEHHAKITGAPVAVRVDDRLAMSCDKAMDYAVLMGPSRVEPDINFGLPPFTEFIISREWQRLCVVGYYHFNLASSPLDRSATILQIFDPEKYLAVYGKPHTNEAQMRFLHSKRDLGAVNFEEALENANVAKLAIFFHNVPRIYSNNKRDTGLTPRQESLPKRTDEELRQVLVAAKAGQLKAEQRVGNVLFYMGLGDFVVLIIMGFIGTSVYHRYQAFCASQGLEAPSIATFMAVASLRDLTDGLPRLPYRPPDWKDPEIERAERLAARRAQRTVFAKTPIDEEKERRDRRNRNLNNMIVDLLNITPPESYDAQEKFCDYIVILAEHDFDAARDELVAAINERKRRNEQPLTAAAAEQQGEINPETQ